MAAALFYLGIFAFLALSYLAQKFAPPPKPKIVGIDLGTSYSSIGVYHPVSGKAEILADEFNRTLFPSVVAFQPNGSRLIGVDAVSLRSQNPRGTIFEAKRFIGRKYSQLKPSLFSRFPFRIEDRDGLPVFAVEPSSSSESSHVVPALYYSPEQIGSFIISHLVSVASKRVGAQITKAVLSVPAEFDEVQRNATRRAAELAGVEVLRILNEPTAAAMAYGLHKKEHVSTILVFDLGGGTLDVSLLGIQGGVFSTFAIAGNSHLGGEDFSHSMLEFVSQMLREKYDDRIYTLDLQQKLRNEIDRVKIRLSSDFTVELVLRINSTETFSYQFTRELFEKLNEETFLKVLVPVEKVLAEASMEASEVDEIVLVGGSTRIPKVREILTRFFGKAPNTDVNPDEAVAIGVSVQAGIMGGAWPLQVSAIEIPVKLRKIDID